MTKVFLQHPVAGAINMRETLQQHLPQVAASQFQMQQKMAEEGQGEFD